MTTTERPFHAAAAWVWAFASLVWWFASLALALPLATYAPELGGSWDLAKVLGVNGVLSLVGVWLLGRGLLHQSLRRPRVGMLAPVVGIGIAIAEEVALHGWADARFGYYDSELIWWTAGLSPTLILTAVALFGVLIAPRGALAPPLFGLALAAAGVTLIFVSNLPGLVDGIDARSWPLAPLVGISAAYAVAAVVIGVRRATGR